MLLDFKSVNGDVADYSLPGTEPQRAGAVAMSHTIPSHQIGRKQGDGIDDSQERDLLWLAPTVGILVSASAPPHRAR